MTAAMARFGMVLPPESPIDSGELGREAETGGGLGKEVAGAL